MIADCVIAGRDRLGECTIWDARTKKLWWVDILEPNLQSFDPLTGEHRKSPLKGRECGSFAIRKAGGFVLAMDDGLYSFDPLTGAHEFLVDPEPGLSTNRLNDGRADRAGRFWVGSMQCDMRAAAGALYRIDPDLRVTRMLGDITIPNSITFSPDDRVFYFADSSKRLIWAFDFDIDAGTLTNQRVFARLDGERGGPDGSCMDAEGCLWNAQYGRARVVRYTPDGRLDRVIEVPAANPTCCCFGGDRLDTLYITSARFELSDPVQAARPMEGSLFAVVPGVCGLPEASFGG